MSLAARPYGQGFRLVCNGKACGRQFNPRRFRDLRRELLDGVEHALRQRAELYGWTSKALAPGYRFDFCPEHTMPAGKPTVEQIARWCGLETKKR